MTHGKDGSHRRGIGRRSRRSRPRRAFRLDGLETRRLADRVLPTLTVTNFPIPLVGLVEPQGIATGPDGNLWFAESGADRIGRMTPSGVLTEFSLPETSPPGSVDLPSRYGSTVGPTVITTGPDGALWFVGQPGEAGRITTSGTVTEYPVPDVPASDGSAAYPPTLTAIAAGPDGALWFTGALGEVGRFTPGGVVSEFPIPGSIAGDHEAEGPGLQAIAVAPDGSLWDTDNSGKIDRISTTGVVIQFSIPLNNDVFGGIAAGPDGNLWFTEDEGLTPAGQQAAVREITPTGVTTLHNIPPGMTLDPGRGVDVDPSAIVAGADGALWFAEGGGDTAIGRITTGGTIGQLSIANDGNLVRSSDGALWYTDNGAFSRMARDGTTRVFNLPATSNVSLLTPGKHGTLWFLDDVGPELGNTRPFIGRITPRGTIKLFRVPIARPEWEGSPVAMAAGPDGGIDFVGGDYSKSEHTSAYVGQVTARGQIRLFTLPPSLSPGATFQAKDSSYYGTTGSLVTGPDGRLWFAADDRGVAGIARVSTEGKLESFIPASVTGQMVRGPEGRAWFSSGDPASGTYGLGVATRSGTFVSRDLPGPDSSVVAANGIPGLALGPGGALWYTDGVSVVGRISGLDSVAGGLDDLNRPRHAPDFIAPPLG
jgi:streptogramin lyase